MNKKISIGLSCVFLYLLLTLHITAQERQTKNLVLITLDGLRWQDLFYGPDDSLINNTLFVKDIPALVAAFKRKDTLEARRNLMPFFWDSIAVKGQLIGNRSLKSFASVTNRHWFSYPGYNEILTGFSDPLINTNNKLYNQNTTVLEWLNNFPEYRGRVAAFCSWDVFPFIINDKRSNIPVNAGFMEATGNDLTLKERYLNELQQVTPSPWNSVRLDVFTHEYAKEYIRKNHPKVLFISYGETDDFAHDGRYDHYLHAAKRTDGFIHDLWKLYQSDPFYRGNTTFLITTDHGRGDLIKKEWTSHGNIIKGSNEIWFAVIGPDTPALGERHDTPLIFQNQVAATAAAFLGLNYSHPEKEIGTPVLFFFK
jgi:hypothetical protein